MGVSLIEVFFSVELVVGNEVKGYLEIFDVLFFFFDVIEIFVDYLLFEGCIIEERWVFEGIFFEDEKSFFDFELFDSVKGGDVDLIFEFVK